MKSIHLGVLALAAAALACSSGGSSSSNGGGAGGDGAGGSSAAGGTTTNTGGNATAGNSNQGGNANQGGNSNGGAGQCVAGVECTGFPTTFERGCTNDVSCVGEVHQTDCCGALRVMGMNHSEASTFCPAENGATGCRPQYPDPGNCTSDSVVTDTGTTNSLDNVATQCADIDTQTGIGTCTTFVCGTSSTPACPANRDIGTCGP